MNELFANINYKLQNPEAKGPTRANESDAGNDLYADETVTILPGATSLVKTGISMAIPEYAYGQIASRSSLAKKGVFVTGGVIDPAYRGEIGVLLINTSNEPYTAWKGDRIAQMIVLTKFEVTWVEAKDLDQTTRGEGGFGSSGI